MLTARPALCAFNSGRRRSGPLGPVTFQPFLNWAVSRKDSVRNSPVNSTLMAFAILAICAGDRANAQWPRDFQNCFDHFLELNATVYDRPGTDLGLGLITDSVTNEVLFY